MNQWTSSGAADVVVQHAPRRASALRVCPFLLACALTPFASWAQATDQATRTESTPTTAQTEQFISDAAASAKKAEQAAQDAKSILDEIKTGKLISSGLTAGVALSVQTPIGSTNGTHQDSVNAVAMPYLMAVPGYWWLPQATREYCASSWGAGDESASQDAAIAIAARRATLLFTKIVDAIRAGEEDDLVIATALLGDLTVQVSDNGAERLAHVAQGIVQAARKWNNNHGTPEQKDEIISWLADQDWNPARRGSCVLTKFGAWIGKPADYQVRGTLEGTSLSDAKFTPAAAFGLAFSPNAYFSFLVGVTVGTLSDSSAGSGVNASATCWGGTIAVGGNVDLVGGLFK